jgi:hypothetical protein
MPGIDEFWNREDLYNEVWSTPMRTLARRYGVSDVGLAKICRKLVIPLPGRGYWARKEAGQTVERVALAPIKENIRLRKPTRRKEAPPVQDVATEQERVQIENLEISVGEPVLKHGDLSHPLVVQARAAFKGATLDRRNLLDTPKHCLDIRVSKESLDRALRLMAGLIGKIESEGFTVALREDSRETTVATVLDQQITFGIVERVHRVDLVVPPPGGVLDRVLAYGGKPATFEPCGRLSVEIWHPWGAHLKRWADKKTQSLEERIPQIVAGFIRIALVERDLKEKRAAEERARRQREEEMSRLRESIRAEQSRVRVLRNAAASWSRAEQIRSFLAAARDSALMAGQSIEPGSPFGDWLTWAERQADRLDPLSESPISILDRKDEVEREHVGYYGYRKPEPLFRFPKPIWRME